MGRLTAGVAEVLRVTFRREPLPPAPPAASRGSAAGPGPLARLLSPEPLPPPPDAPGSAPSAPDRGALSLLLSPEPLPPDLPPARARRGRWLAWLLAPERLEP